MGGVRELRRVARAELRRIARLQPKRDEVVAFDPLHERRDHRRRDEQPDEGGAQAERAPHPTGGDDLAVEHLELRRQDEPERVPVRAHHLLARHRVRLLRSHAPVGALPNLVHERAIRHHERRHHHHRAHRPDRRAVPVRMERRTSRCRARTAREVTRRRIALGNCAGLRRESCAELRGARESLVLRRRRLDDRAVAPDERLVAQHAAHVVRAQQRERARLLLPHQVARRVVVAGEALNTTTITVEAAGVRRRHGERRQAGRRRVRQADEQLGEEAPAERRLLQKVADVRRVVGPLPREQVRVVRVEVGDEREREQRVGAADDEAAPHVRAGRVEQQLEVEHHHRDPRHRRPQQRVVAPDRRFVLAPVLHLLREAAREARLGFCGARPRRRRDRRLAEERRLGERQRLLRQEGGVLGEAPPPDAVVGEVVVRRLGKARRLETSLDALHV